MRRISRIVGLGLYALLVSLFAAGYLARYLPPRYFWWAELIGVGLPYLSALLVAATLLVPLLFKSWPLRIGHLILLGLIALRFWGNSWWNGRASADDSEALTVMSYNVPPWTGLSPAAQRDSLRRIVERAHPHLVALQETGITLRFNETPRFQGRPYATTLADSGDFRIIGPSDDAPTHTPQPVFGKVPLVEQSQVVLRRDEQDQRATYVTRTHFRWQDQSAVHYNLHLRSFGERKPWRDNSVRPLSPRTWYSYLRQYRAALLDRAWEARQIQQILNEEELPFIVSGDFNSTPHGWAYWHLADGLTDVFRAVGSGWGGTWHARFPFARIDFVLASSEWRALSARVPVVYLSDHRPLVVQLQWKE